MMMMKKISTVLLLMISTAVAETNCTTNTLGDRTCVTTTGNILSNSTFGSNNTTTTTGWLTTGSDGIHTHGNFGTFPYGANMDQTGGVLAFEGYVEDNVFQDSALVKHGHLTQSQINEGFTSTLSADVWFWNSIENTLTLKQTITGSDGSITTQSRTINDHDPTRNFNGGTFTNYTDSYIQSPNSQTDITIRAELYNQGDGSNNDSYHRGPDVDNVQLSITTLGETTGCQQLGTCTSVGTELNTAFEEIEEVIETRIEKVEFEPIEEIIFIPFEEPRMIIETFEEIFIQELTTEEINTGIVNVFNLPPPGEIKEVAEIEEFEELPEVSMEVQRYEEPQTIETFTAEIERTEDITETRESFNNETENETIQEVENTSGENEREPGTESNETRIAGNTREPAPESETVARNESETQTESNQQESPEEENLVGSDERESGAGETRVSGSEEITTESAEPVTEEVVENGAEDQGGISIDIASVQDQVAKQIKSIDKQIVATQMIVAKAMQSNNKRIDSYGTLNENIFNDQLEIDGGTLDDFYTRDYSDNRNLYAEIQNPYNDRMAQYQKKVEDAVANRIRAEEELKIIRGY
tara:strand:+ start:1078 stop:2838 length:1761 start_codon:yes stop_codon:yes gene_type:complete